MNVPITYFGWFWRPLFEIFFTRSVHNLESCYYNSVGANATLLINVPPNNKRELPKKFINKLNKTKHRIEKRFSNKAEVISTIQNKNIITVKIKPQTVKTIIISEDVTKRQRIEVFSIVANNRIVYKGRTIGFKKICVLKNAVKNCNEIKIHIKNAEKNHA